MSAFNALCIVVVCMSGFGLMGIGFFRSDLAGFIGVVVGLFIGIGVCFYLSRPQKTNK